MKVSILGSTQPGYAMTTEEALRFSGHEAGICYMPNTLDEIFGEDAGKTAKRVEMTLGNYHHSVFGHPFFNFSFEGIPKILAMILNNEKVYTTSEKSARYTKMQTSGREKELYEKWLVLFADRIHELYPDIPLAEVNKLAQENARYLISVFTPATTMGYTVSLQQINYILGWMKDEIDRPTEQSFFLKLKPVLQEFYDQVYPLVGVEGLRDNKSSKLSLFAERERNVEFGENYSVNTEGSFAYLAQAQRHRTLQYEVETPIGVDGGRFKTDYYIPRCIEHTDLEQQWKEDICSIGSNFPQGTLLNINERGTVENFIKKCKERLCGRAQLETCQVTSQTLKMYAKHSSGVVFNGYLNRYTGMYVDDYGTTARCTFPDFTCTNPCRWGAEKCFSRLV